MYPTMDEIVQGFQIALLKYDKILYAYELTYRFNYNNPPSETISRAAMEYNQNIGEREHIVGLIRKIYDIEAAGDRVRRLATSGTTEILEREIQYLKNYLEFHRIKYGLQVFSIDPDRNHEERAYVIFEERLHMLENRLEQLRSSPRI